ncbi:hypothetical protein P4S63_19310 [Pseudoalteromonas sp. B193]
MKEDFHYSIDNLNLQKNYGALDKWFKEIHKVYTTPESKLDLKNPKKSPVQGVIYNSTESIQDNYDSGLFGQLS